MPLRRTPLLLVALLVAVLGGAWTLGSVRGWWEGVGAESEERRAPDLSTWQKAFDAAMDAVHRRDLTGLEAVMTPDGFRKVLGWLAEWQALLTKPTEGPRILRNVREERKKRGDEVSAEEIERAQHGAVDHVFDFFLKAAPRPAKPTQKGMRVDPANPNQIEVVFEDVVGNLRSARLLRTPGGWRVDDLPL